MRDALGRVDRVLVIGGTSDIGNAIATALVERRGARHVVLTTRGPEGVEEREAALTRAGATVAVAGLDLADDRPEAAVDAIFDEHGDVDVVILAAGVLGDQARAEEEFDHLRDVLQVNVVGGAVAAMAVARRLRQQGTGTLVVLSSVAALQARRANFVYGASKAGLDAFARGLSDMLAGTGAEVLVVRPGFVRSRMTAGMTEAPFAQDPDEVADAVLAGLQRGRTVVHTSAPVAALGKVLQGLPRPLVRKLPR